MKAIRLFTIIVAFLLFYINGIQAQTQQAKLNQVELNKQFVGVWKAEMGKDTTLIMDTRNLYNGFEAYLKTESKGKVIMEGKSLLGYDKKTDKLMDFYLNNINPEITLLAAWFTSANKCEEVLLEDISNPEKAYLKWTFEFKSPNLMIWTQMINGKIIGIYTFHREK